MIEAVRTSETRLHGDISQKALICSDLISARCFYKSLREKEYREFPVELSHSEYDANVIREIVHNDVAIFNMWNARIHS
jgi:hypothetical protein